MLGSPDESDLEFIDNTCFIADGEASRVSLLAQQVIIIIILFMVISSLGEKIHALPEADCSARLGKRLYARYAAVLCRRKTPTMTLISRRPPPHR